MPGVSVLFVRRRSVYKSMDLDCYDEDRDARTYEGENAVVAHPPCRGWGRLSHFSLHDPAELDLGRFAVSVVRRVGGVLEHPACSKLWQDQNLPIRGVDRFGGWTFPISQSWFGHRAPKLTWLYVVGVAASQLPPIPFHLGVAAGRIERMSHAEREATPAQLAVWLVHVARLAYLNRGEHVCAA